MDVIVKVSALCYVGRCGLMYSEHRGNAPVGAVVRYELARHIVAHVVRLVYAYGLKPLTEVHSAQLPAPHPWLIAATQLRSAVPCTFGALLEAQVECRLVAYGDALERLNRLVVLEHLHARNILCLNVVCGDAISAIEHIQALDVELANSLAIILYLARLANREARHLAQYIAYATIRGVDKCGDIVCDGVGVALHGCSAHHYLLYLKVGVLYFKVNTLCAYLNLPRLRF